MKKTRSLLALLLLGGMVLAGCDKKNKDTIPGDSGTPTQSGTGDQGGSSGGSSSGGDQGSGGQQGGEGGGQQGGEGGGQQGGGDVQVDHFGNKKLTIESITANPADHLAEIQTMYANAYLSLFSEGSAVEMILPIGGGEFQALLGTYAVSQDGLTATITATDSYISTLHMHLPVDENDVAPFALTFDAATSKYSMTMPVEEPIATPTWQATATFVCVAAQEAPTHADIPAPEPIAWPAAKITSFLEVWGIEHDTVPVCGVEGVTQIMVYPETIKDNTNGFNVILMGGAANKAAYLIALGEAGYTETSAGSHSYRSTNNEITIGVYEAGNDLSISISNNSLVYYHISNTNGWDITEDDPEFFIWVWDEGGNNKWYSLGEPEEDGLGGYEFYISLKNTWTGAKIVRVDPNAAIKPVEGSTTYGTYNNSEIWNETSNLELHPLMPNVEFSF